MTRWSMAFGTCLVLAAALAPARARACSIDSPHFGVEIFDWLGDEPMVVAPDGVLALWADVFAVELADVAAMFSLTLSGPDGDVATTTEVVVLKTELYNSYPLWRVALVFRPAGALTPGATYTALLEGGWPESFAVAVAEGPMPPLAAPPATIEVDIKHDGFRGAICCERGIDSCGGTSDCTYTIYDVLPAPYVRAPALEPALGRSVYLWAAPVLADGTLGPREGQPGWDGTSGWEFVFRDAQAQYCAIVGMTSLVDGATVQGEPVCATFGEVDLPVEKVREPSEEELAEMEASCDTPLVYEDGTPYREVPAAEGGGCRMGKPSSPAGLVVLLAWRRRRRARR